jgi:signal transduction histidine kinase
MARKRWWRGLLARVTVAYAIGSLFLSTIVAWGTFTLAQNRLLDAGEERALAQFLANANQVRAALEGLGPEANEERRGVVYTTLADQLFQRTTRSQWKLITPDGPLGPLAIEQIPEELRAEVITDYWYDFRYRDPVQNTPQLAYGMYLVNLDTQYYEVVDLSEVDATLSDLRRILFGVATLASLAGAALGYYAARRALAPVGDVSEAAQAIAAGDFKTRLDLQADPDLALLSSSFNEMVDALADRLERDARFASDVSHELRSPLMTLTASVEILERRKASLPDVVQQAIGLLRQDLTRFENLVEDLLEISRLDAGAEELQASEFRLAEFLLNVIAQSRSPEIDLDYDPAHAELLISADKRRLAQVMTNLIDNAKKYAGGATGISFKRIGDCAQIVVEDRGPGVAPADRQRIFQRFSRADADAGKRGQDTGVGLGLSLVAEHVRLHEGQVWVTDRDDGEPGARFVVELPIQPDDETVEEMAL